MREFYLSPLQYNKWEYQQRENKKECCWCEYNSITVGNIKNIYKDKNIYQNMDI